jgi:hypothetical protein
MGCRISLQFTRGKQQSVALFSHWQGETLEEEAHLYVENLKKDIEDNKIMRGEPLGRFDPETVMVDFIRHITKNLPRVTHDLYLGATEENGDNSDHGNVEIALPTLRS